jgi:hypothetical protein
MNNFTRRQILRATILFVTLGLSLSQMAVSCGAIFAKILQYATVGLQAFQSVVDLLAGLGLINVAGGAAIDATIALVKVGFADLQIAVNDYNSAPAANKSTLEGRISTTIQVLQNDIGKFWTGLTLPDAKMASLVAGLLGIITSTLAGFATQLPPAPAALKMAMPVALGSAAKMRSTSQFKKDFNAVLNSAGYSRYAI